MTSDALDRRARRLSYFTVAYNLLEGTVSVVAGAAAGSAALIGFGVDSFIESLSGSVMIWRFWDRSASGGRRDDAERRAIRLVGYTFFLLAAYVLFEAGQSLVLGQPPEASPIGIAIAIISLVVMPLLYIAKRRAARAIGSRSLLADARQTLACMLLSVALLIGLGANYLFGLWQLDPIAAILIAVFLVREGREAIEEGRLCEC